MIDVEPYGAVIIIVELCLITVYGRCHSIALWVGEGITLFRNEAHHNPARIIDIDLIRVDCLVQSEHLNVHRIFIGVCRNAGL